MPVLPSRLTLRLASACPRLTSFTHNLVSLHCEILNPSSLIERHHYSTTDIARQPRTSESKMLYVKPSHLYLLLAFMAVIAPSLADWWQGTMPLSSCESGPALNPHVLTSALAVKAALSSPGTASTPSPTGFDPFADDSTDLFAAARQRLSQIQTSSTCKQLATVKLLGTCENLRLSTHHSDLEVVHNLYAAHLALCELEGANTKLPASCRLGLPSGVDNVVEVLDDEGRAQLSRCLAALHEKAQWWTSYSNNRQDAYIWCKAMRPGFDQGEFALSCPLPFEFHMSEVSLLTDDSGICKVSQRLARRERRDRPDPRRVPEPSPAYKDRARGTHA